MRPIYSRKHDEPITTITFRTYIKSAPTTFNRPDNKFAPEKIEQSMNRILRGIKINGSDDSRNASDSIRINHDEQRNSIFRGIKID
jgi:hypothetical protein